jgi:hypothetical protein
LSDRSAQSLKRFDEKRFNVVRLETPRFRALHVFANPGNPARVHRVMRERPLFQKVLKVGPIHSAFDGLSQARPHIGPLSVANGFDQQFPQRPSLELQFA